MKSYSICGTFLLLLVVLYSCNDVFGDGCYIGEAAYKKLPEIPSQRAALFYREGRETLVIESAISGEGERFGWIIPLPSPPTKVEQASPGIIKTLSLAIGPKVVLDYNLHDDLLLAKFFMLWIVLTSGMILTFKPKGLLLTGLIMLILFGVSIVIVLPALGRVREFQDSKMSAVHVRDKRIVGSYEIQVLKADDIRILNRWLKDSGFMLLPERGEKIVADYIKEGWCFVTVKFRREGVGFSRPYPLAMTFQSKKPIYPMRLTSLAGSTMSLELFVVADQSARAEGLQVEASDRFETRTRYSNEGMHAMHYRMSLGHEALLKMMWEGCVLTKLAGELKPSDMVKDVAVELGDFGISQQVWYSQLGAQGAGLFCSGLFWCIGILGGIAILRRRIEAKDGRWFFLTRVIAPVTLIAMALWGTIYLSVPKIEINKGRVYVRRYPDQIMYQLWHLNQEIKLGDRSRKDVEAALDDYFATHEVFNELTGERVRREESPGNFIIGEKDGKVVILVYDRNGFPQELSLEG